MCQQTIHGCIVRQKERLERGLVLRLWRYLRPSISNQTPIFSLHWLSLYQHRRGGKCDKDMWLTHTIRSSAHAHLLEISGGWYVSR